jgi:hypothetical protein
MRGKSRHLRREKGKKRCLVKLNSGSGYPMKILWFGLFGLALVTSTTAMITGSMSDSTVALVTVQTLPTLPDWRAP